MLKQIDVIAKFIFLKKYSFSSLSKLANILFRDLITSMPSNVENIVIKNDDKTKRLAKSKYDIKSFKYWLSKLHGNELLLSVKEKL